MSDILICGSSCTSGDGLKDRNDAWPSVFEKLSNKKSVNLAVDGGSVDYVFYTIIKEVSIHNYKNVIITWPPLGRTLLVRRENNFLINGTPTFTNSLYGDTPEFKKFLNLFYKYWTNELYDLKFTLQKIVAMQNFLENKKCNYLFVNTSHYNLEAWASISTVEAVIKDRLLSAFDLMNDEQILNEQAEINSYINQLNFEHYHDPVNYNLMDDCYNKNLIDTKSNHPTIDGHLYLAKLIWQLWNGDQ
jgi:hypothetical protein